MPCTCHSVLAQASAKVERKRWRPASSRCISSRLSPRLARGSFRSSSRPSRRSSERRRMMHPARILDGSTLRSGATEDGHLARDEARRSHPGKSVNSEGNTCTSPAVSLVFMVVSDDSVATNRLRQAGPMVLDCKQQREPGLACSHWLGDGPLLTTYPQGNSCCHPSNPPPLVSSQCIS